MKLFYYAAGSEQKGPFTLDELAHEKITRDIKVWFEGLDEWKPAGDVEELKGLLRVVPPPLNSSGNKQMTNLHPLTNPPRKRYLRIAVVSGIILVITALSTVFITNYNKQRIHDDFYEQTGGNEVPAPAPKPMTEAELKAQLYEKECENGSTYISGENLESEPIYKNLLSLKVVGVKLRGTLFNNAKLATLKDVRVKVSFLSRTSSVLFTRNFVVYSFIKPNSSLRFTEEVELTNQEYKDFSNISWSIEGAACAR